jgi:hypothetical protein
MLTGRRDAVVVVLTLRRRNRACGSTKDVSATLSQPATSLYLLQILKVGFTLFCLLVRSNACSPHNHHRCGVTRATGTIGCPCSGNGTMSRRPNYSTCNTSQAPTNNAVKTRSINRGAVPGSPEDVYKYMPWRAPGTAIPADPCGVSGHARACTLLIMLRVVRSKTWGFLERSSTTRPSDLRWAEAK